MIEASEEGGCIEETNRNMEELETGNHYGFRQSHLRRQ